MDELREFVRTFDNQQACPYCPYVSEKEGKSNLSERRTNLDFLCFLFI